MSLDTKYRPFKYDDILGQQSIATVLRRIVASGAGRHQSYLFAGSYGGGKTTLGRILARALLCDSPVQGDPCDNCPSCKSFLKTGTNALFTEIDAATNSGKADVKRMVEELDYQTFSDKRRIYLFDESHQLTKDALDSLLKPLEDNISESDDKRMVCIFCTTEPEKMRATILSRCAPAFILQPVAPSDLGSRISYICNQEGIYYELDAVQVLAEETLPHIRDSLKILEAVSSLGGLTKNNLFSYLNLGARTKALEALSAFACQDEDHLVRCCESLLSKAGPQSCYETLTNACLTLYRYGKNIGPLPSYWEQASASQVYRKLQRQLVVLANKLARPPYKPTGLMFICDVMELFHSWITPTPQSVVVQSVTPVFRESAATPTATETVKQSVFTSEVYASATKFSGIVSGQTPVTPYVTSDGTYVDPRAIKPRVNKPEETKPATEETAPVDFATLTSLIDQELGLLLGKASEHEEVGKTPKMGDT